MQVEKDERRSRSVAEGVENNPALKNIDSSGKPFLETTPQRCNHGFRYNHGCTTLARVRSWVLLSYRIPREPSTPRIAVWRQLRRLGALQIGDGVAALPLDKRTREHMEWLAAEIEEAGGEAVVWLAEPSSRAEQRLLERRHSERQEEVRR